MTEYDFSKIHTGASITSEWVLSRISDAQIFYYYHGRFKIGVACTSSLRKDERPSVTFFIGRTGKINYWDFRDQRAFDCFDYVQALFGCSFKQALQRVAEDFGLIGKGQCKVSEKILSEANRLDRTVERNTIIQFIPGEWTKEHLLFWRFYRITQEELERESVYPVKKLFLNKQEIVTADSTLRFAKVQKYEEDGIERTGVKIYSPHDRNMKWLSSIPLSVPFGLDTLSYDSNVVMITKSFKDMIVLRKLFTSVIATQNESEAALPESVINLLDQHFDRKIVIFDNDETGVANSIKFNSRGFGYFNIPEVERIRFGIKDCSDYVKAYGLDALRDLFVTKNLL